MTSLWVRSIAEGIAMEKDFHGLSCIKRIERRIGQINHMVNRLEEGLSCFS